MVSQASGGNYDIFSVAVKHLCALFYLSLYLEGAYLLSICYSSHTHWLSACSVLGKGLTTGIPRPSLKEMVFWWQVGKFTDKST